MKKYLIVITAILTFIVLLGVSNNTARAEGGKVRGDEAEGPAYQLGDCPFTG